MIAKLKVLAYKTLRWSEKYTKTDMVYLASSSFWMNLNTLISTAFAFVLSVAFANLIPKETYGTYQFVISIGSIFGAITLTGINGAITQAVARGLEGSFKKSIITQLKWSVVPFSVAILISLYYVVQNNLLLAASILAVGILIPISNAFNTYSAFIAGKKDFKKAFFYSQILNFSYYPIMVLGLFLTQNPVFLILINFGTNAVVTIILYILTVRFYKPNASEDKETLSFGKHMSLASILGIAVLQLDNVLVYHFIGAAPLAVYAFATNIPDRFNNLFKSVSVAALPKFSAQTEENLKKTIFSKSIRFALFTLCGSLLFIALAPLFYHILFPKYESSILYAQGYSLVLALLALSSMPINALLATKARKEIYIYSFLNPTVSIATMVIGALTYGVWGIIIAKGISNIVSFFILLYLINNKKSA